MNLWTYKWLIMCTIVELSLITGTGCVCVLPFSTGTWISSSRGIWTIQGNKTEIQNFKATLVPSQTIVDLSCVSNSGNKYTLGTSTSIEILSGIFVNSYTCIEIQTTSNSPSTYEFYFITDIDIATGEPFSSNVIGVCDGSVIRTASNTNILVAEGADADAIKVSLPNIIQGDYNVTITDQNSVTSNQTLLGSCNDTSSFYFTHTVDSTQTTNAVAFSDSGVLYNLKSFTLNNITFIYTYNNDTTVNSATTYRFACWAIDQTSDSSIVYATVYPEVCEANQNATYVPSGGQVLVLNPSATCHTSDISEDESSLSVALITAIVLILVVIMIVTGHIIIAIIYYIRKKNQKDLSNSLTNDAKVGDRSHGHRGLKRPKSSNDLDSARLINEKNKQKMAKKMAKKIETRSIAVQASIWTAPIKRTTTALEEGTRIPGTQGPVKFIPYVDRPVITTKQAGEIENHIPRSYTTMESRNINKSQKPVMRSKTTLERNGVGPRASPRYLKRKHEVRSTRQKLMAQISEMNSLTSEKFAYQFDKLFQFPFEGNPNEFHNTLEITSIPDEKPDSAENRNNDVKDKVAQDTTKGIVERAAPDKSKLEKLDDQRERENTKTSLKSRPSTTEGLLSLKLKHTGSVRKTHSAQMVRSRIVNTYSYHSPYAMSDSQKGYVLQKTAWIREQLNRSKQSKNHTEEMKRLEGQRAFDEWMKNKRNTIKRVRNRYSRSSTITSRTNTSSVKTSETAAVSVN